MSPVFRKYVRPVGATRGVTYAIADVGYVSPPNRISVRRFPVKLGYHNRASAARLTSEDVADLLRSLHGDQQELLDVVGIVQRRPKSERKGVYFTKAAQKRARIRQAAEAAALHRKMKRAKDSGK